MKPTNELRFVEREIVVKPMTASDPSYTTEVVRILQQKWAGEKYNLGTGYTPVQEWRDVPLEKE